MPENCMRRKRSTLWFFRLMPWSCAVPLATFNSFFYSVSVLHKIWTETNLKFLCPCYNIWHMEINTQAKPLIIIIIIIAFKGAIRDFLQSPHSAANCFQHARSRAQAQPCANHVQHNERLSRASVILRATWYEGTAQLISLTELKSHLFEFILLAESLNQWRRGGNRRRALENATYYSPKIQAPSKTRTRAGALVAG